MAGIIGWIYFRQFFYQFVASALAFTFTYEKTPGRFAAGRRGSSVVTGASSGSLSARCVAPGVSARCFSLCPLIIDPAGSVGPRGTGCDLGWKLVLCSVRVLATGLGTLRNELDHTIGR